MNLLEPQDWTFPVPIAYGPGRLRETGTFCQNHGITRPLVVTDKGSSTLPFLEDLMVILDTAGLASAVYSDISPNPRDDEIAAGKALYLSGEHDGIIAIGGGSGMDGGKAIALTCNNDHALWAFEFEQEAPDMSSNPPFPPLITLPTTAGTGAETDSTAMITDTVKGMKWCIWHADMKPALTILDPELTVGLPSNLTAWTGVDALVHAIEAFCVPGFNPLCDGMALEGLRLIAHWLPVAVREPTNLEARGAMQVGACLAGISFMKGLGLVHAISHMIGAEYDTQHGLTNAIVLPAVLEFNAPDIKERIPPMTQAMGLSDDSFDAFYQWTCNLLDEVQIPLGLKSIGVPAGCENRIATKALQDSAAATNPRTATLEDVEAIINKSLDSGR